MPQLNDALINKACNYERPTRTSKRGRRKRETKADYYINLLTEATIGTNPKYWNRSRRPADLKVAVLDWKAKAKELKEDPKKYLQHHGFMPTNLEKFFAPGDDDWAKPAGLDRDKVIDVEPWFHGNPVNKPQKG